jgi:hypothetical protein
MFIILAIRCSYFNMINFTSTKNFKVLYPHLNYVLHLHWINLYSSEYFTYSLFIIFLIYPLYFFAMK